MSELQCNTLGPIFALVPARGGSKGVTRKNLREVGGRTLVARAVASALDSGRMVDVVVSSDSDEILEEGLRAGAQALRRPAELSSDSAGAADVVRHFIESWAPLREAARATIAYLQPTSPLRSASHVREAVDRLVASGRGALVSVRESRETPFKMFRLGQNGELQSLFDQHLSNANRQSLPATYVPNGAIYLFDRDVFLRYGGFPSNGAEPFVMGDNDGVDVDREEDLSKAENILGVAKRRDSRCRGLSTGGGMPELEIAGRKIGPAHTPIVIAEIGINHEGSIDVAIEMADAAIDAGAEMIKHQTHIVEDEMTDHARTTIPANADVSIYEIMARCALNEADERRLKDHIESRGSIFLSTPFSRAAANRLASFDVDAFKIGSGECNNYPLIRHIARFGKPMIVSTGMNSVETVRPSVDIMRAAGVSFALLHCTNAYPTPPELVRLGAMQELATAFPDAIIGLSDHTLNNFACLGAVALGASVLERHFTDKMERPGPDIVCSMDPAALHELIEGSKTIHRCLGGRKEPTDIEKPTIDFAFASVVSIADIAAGEAFTEENIWVKRPGGGAFTPADFDGLLGRQAGRDIAAGAQLKRDDVA